jgi:excisionase family DNA binding protein
MRETDGAADAEGLSIKQAAEFAGVSTSWLYKAAGRGEVPSFRVGARRLFRRSALVEWMAERESDEARRLRRERAAVARAAGLELVR